MSDILQECANSFLNVSQYNYSFIVGKKKNVTFQLNMGCSIDEFTHIIGLDHLKDIKYLSTHNCKIKSSTFQSIISGNIALKDIAISKFFYNTFSCTYNSTTQKEYTITDRIKALKNIDILMDKAYNGSIYKWNSYKCRVITPKGIHRKISISADYLLTIPTSALVEPNSTEKAIPDEKIYLFAYQENKGAKKDEPIKLSIFSAFADCVDLTRGQERPMTILQETKEHIKTKTIENIYTHPSYAKELKEKEERAETSSNIIKVEFKSPEKAGNTAVLNPPTFKIPSLPNLWGKIKKLFSNKKSKSIPPKKATPKKPIQKPVIKSKPQENFPKRQPSSACISIKDIKKLSENINRNYKQAPQKHKSKYHDEI